MLKRLKSGCKQVWERFSGSMHSLNMRKLLCITILCLALDSGTAILHSQLNPEGFAQSEQNEYFRRALAEHDLVAYLQGEGIRLGMVFGLFALAVFRPVYFGLLMLVFPMMLLVAASTNLTAILIFPSNATLFIAIELVVTAVIFYGFMIRGRRFYVK